MSEETKVINEDLTNPAPTEGESEETLEEEVVLEEATPAPGSKTDPALLLEALKDEREKKRELAAKVKELEEQISSSNPDTEIYSDEGKILKNYISTLEDKLSDVLKSSEKKDVLMDYPQLQDKWTEFEEFRSDPDNKGMSLKTSAKAFLVENGLFTTRRKGLEKPTGGDKTPKPAGLTTEDVENIRKNDARRYKKLLAEGALDKIGA